MQVDWMASEPSAQTGGGVCQASRSTAPPRSSVVALCGLAGRVARLDEMLRAIEDARDANPPARIVRIAAK